MNYCNDTLAKGNLYQVYRNGFPFDTCHGIVDKITETGHIHISFSGVVEIKENDILKNTDNQNFHVIYSALTTEKEKNDKRLVICTSDKARKKMLSERNFSRYHEIINTVIALAALLVALFKN